MTTLAELRKILAEQRKAVRETVEQIEQIEQAQFEELVQKAKATAPFAFCAVVTVDIDERGERQFIVSSDEPIKTAICSTKSFTSAWLLEKGLALFDEDGWEMPPQ